MKVQIEIEDKAFKKFKEFLYRCSDGDEGIDNEACIRDLFEQGDMHGEIDIRDKVKVKEIK